MSARDYAAELDSWRRYARVLVQCYASAGLSDEEARVKGFANPDERAILDERAFAIQNAVQGNLAAAISQVFSEIQSALRVVYDYAVHGNGLFSLTRDNAYGAAGGFSQLDARVAEMLVLLVLGHEMHVQTRDVPRDAYSDALQRAYARNNMGRTLTLALNNSFRPRERGRAGASTDLFSRLDVQSSAQARTAEEAAEAIDVSTLLAHLASASLLGAHDTRTPLDAGFMDLIGNFNALAFLSRPTSAAAGLAVCALLLIANRDAALFPAPIAEQEYNALQPVQKLAYVMYTNKASSESARTQYMQYHTQKGAITDTSYASAAAAQAAPATTSLWKQALRRVRAAANKLELDDAVTVLTRIGDIAEARLRPDATPAQAEAGAAAYPALVFVLAADTMHYRAPYESGPADAPGAPPSRLLELSAGHKGVLVETLAALVWLYAISWEAEASLGATERAGLAARIAGSLQRASLAEAAQPRALGRATDSLIRLQQGGIEEAIGAIRAEYDTAAAATGERARPHKVGLAVLGVLVELQQAGYTPESAVYALYSAVRYLAAMAQLRQQQRADVATPTVATGPATAEPATAGPASAAAAKARGKAPAATAGATAGAAAVAPAVAAVAAPASAAGAQDPELAEQVLELVAQMVAALESTRVELASRLVEGSIASPDFTYAQATARALLDQSRDVEDFLNEAANEPESVQLLNELRALALGLSDAIVRAAALERDPVDARVPGVLGVPLARARRALQSIGDFLTALGGASA